jgi:hypothetical protein
MTDLDHLPSMVAFGERLDALAERDAKRRRRIALPSIARPAVRTAVAFGAAAVLLGGAYAAPPTRAAVDSLYDNTLGHWVSGDDSASPGRPAAAGEELPDWLASEQSLHGGGTARVLAEAGGDKLVVLRQGDRVTLGVAAFSETGTVRDLRQQLGDRPIKFLAPGRFTDDRHDRRPIFGLASTAITRVQLDYADGTPPVSEDGVRGAFGLTIQTEHRPQSLSGFDASGRLVARQTFVPDVHGASSPADVVGDFRYCPTVAGCPAWPK